MISTHFTDLKPLFRWWPMRFDEQIRFVGRLFRTYAEYPLFRVQLYVLLARKVAKRGKRVCGCEESRMI